MNKLTLISCLFVLFGVASANPAVRESRYAVPIGMFNRMVLVDDDMIDTRSVLSDEVAVPTIFARNTEGFLAPPFTPDQQTEQQRLTIALGGRPYGGYYGSRPWGPSYGRPWGPYGRPWGPYIPNRPWGPY